MTIVCEPDPSISIAVAACTDDAATARIVTDLAAVADLLRTTDPAIESIVVIGPGVDLAEALNFTARTADERPGVRIVLLRKSLNETVRDIAVHRGVREVMSTRDLPFLADACQRLRQSSNRSPAHRRAGRILAVHGATSGQGRTTLAVNLAVVLNAEGHNRVCLVDLDTAFGDLTWFLAGRKIQQTEPSLYPTLATPYLPGLDCVLAPERAGDPVAVPADRTEDVLSVLATVYDYVIVDTPQQVTAQVLSTLDVSHHHVLVAAGERPALRNLRRTLDMLDLLEYPMANRSVVLNRCDSRVTPTRTEVNLLIRNPIAATLPATVDVPASINQGVPLAITRPAHPFVEAVHRFAGALASTVSASGGESGA